jgi:isopentenyl diphosphate isomerase/L-lactate dehydrogenase-like FMN-dependent dehydrogenase
MRNPFSGVKFSLTGSGPITVEDYRQLARRKVPNMVWAYIDGGAEDLVTVSANREAFSRWALKTKVLHGAVAPSTSVTVAGADLDFPVYLSPTGLTGIAHWTGELAAAQAAERVGTRAVISTAASYSIEEIATGTRERHLFQLYPPSAPEGGQRDITLEILKRAEKAGVPGLFVTVDTPTIGNREGERREGMGVPPRFTPRQVLSAALRPSWSIEFLRRNRVSSPMLISNDDVRPGSVESARNMAAMLRPDLVWEDVERIRDHWDKPMYVKGILHPDDAERAVRAGADGVVVSNHGGRQLDGSVAALDALPAVVDRVGGRVPVLLDGGIRRGTDVVKALCLGATAVGIGRPYVYGLAVHGSVGVRGVLEILKDEIDRTLLFMGVSHVSHLDRSSLIPAGIPQFDPGTFQGAALTEVPGGGS